MTNYKLIKEQLRQSEVARNDYKLWWIQFVQANYCEEEFEKFVFWRVAEKAISQANYQREVAKIQNTEWLYPCTWKTKQKREKYRIKKTIEYSNTWLFDSIKNWFYKINK